MYKIVIFSSDSIYTYALLKDLIEKYHENIQYVYFSKSLKKQKSKRFILRKLVNGLGFRYYLFALSNKVMLKFKERSVYSLAEKYSIPIKYVVNINDDSVVSELQSTQPDLIIAGYFDQIVKKRILDIPSFGTINVHPSMLPSYRGVKPIFWVLNNNESMTGVTIHMMDEGIDTGDIVLQKEFDVRFDDTFDSLMMRLSLEASSLLIEAVESIKNDNYALKAQDNSKSSYYGQPTKQDLKHFLKSGRRFY